MFNKLKGIFIQGENRDGTWGPQMIICEESFRSCLQMPVILACLDDDRNTLATLLLLSGQS